MTDTTLKFEFRIMLDDECLISDSTLILGADRIDQFGGCETVDTHVASALRAVKRDMAKREAKLEEEKREADLESKLAEKEMKYPNGRPMFREDGMMLDDEGNRSIFDDVDE